jgi:hypothetical protein
MKTNQILFQPATDEDYEKITQEFWQLINRLTDEQIYLIAITVMTREQIENMFLQLDCYQMEIITMLFKDKVGSAKIKKHSAIVATDNNT